MSRRTDQQRLVAPLLIDLHLPLPSGFYPFRQRFTGLARHGRYMNTCGLSQATSVGRPRMALARSAALPGVGMNAILRSVRSLGPEAASPRVAPRVFASAARLGAIAPSFAMGAPTRRPVHRSSPQVWGPLGVGQMVT